MQSVSNDNFGLLIAYVIPGLLIVGSIGYLSPTVAGWLGAAPGSAPTVSGFLYVTVASVAAGMLVSALRWLVFDRLHHRTGITPPDWDFGGLRDYAPMFLTVVEHQYRYYQFYSGVLLALPFLYLVRRLVVSATVIQTGLETAIVLAVMALCAISSRDTLRKYYARMAQLQRGGLQQNEPKADLTPSRSTAAGPRP